QRGATSTEARLCALRAAARVLRGRGKQSPQGPLCPVSVVALLPPLLQNEKGSIIRAATCLRSLQGWRLSSAHDPFACRGRLRGGAHRGLSIPHLDRMHLPG